MTTITLSLSNGLLNINSVCGYTALGSFTQINVNDKGAASIVICTNRSENVFNIMRGDSGFAVMPLFDSKATVNMETVCKAARANGYVGVLTMLLGRDASHLVAA